MGKKKKKTNSWHAITQSKQKRSITPEARVRRVKSIAKMALLSVGIICGLGFFGYGGYVLYNATDHLNLFGGSNSLKKVKLETDGVLDTKWLGQKLKLPKNKDLMQINIFELKKQLEKEEQIHEVVIERVFPDHLKFVIQEHQPIGKIAVKGAGRKQLLLISAEGHIFRGACYAKSFMERLPYITGIKIIKNLSCYEQVAGMDVVASLLEEAEKMYPYIYNLIREVSCKKFSGDKEEIGATLSVRTTDSLKIIFATDNFPLQLKRLDYILQYAKTQRLREMHAIDLTLGDHAVLKQVSNHAARAGLHY